MGKIRIDVAGDGAIGADAAPLLAKPVVKHGGNGRGVDKPLGLVDLDARVAGHNQCHNPVTMGRDRGAPAPRSARSRDRGAAAPPPAGPRLGPTMTSFVRWLRSLIAGWRSQEGQAGPYPNGAQNEPCSNKSQTMIAPDLVVSSPTIGTPSMVAMHPAKMRKAKLRFIEQRQNAHKREIGFRFDFPTWIATWVESGHWHERGRRRGQYVSRPGDRGIYEPGNVEIVLTTVNVDEARKPPTDVTKAKIGAKAKARLREGSPHLAELRAIRRSPAQRRLVSRNSRAMWARRRAEASP